MSRGPRTFHLLFLGDKDVGITSLIEHTPIDYAGEGDWGLGIEFYQQNVRLQEGPARLVMFELGREDSFATVARNFKRDCGVILVYDVTRPTTLANVLDTFSRLKPHLPEVIPRILVANKADLEDSREVDTPAGFAAASAIDAEYLETSVVDKDRENIQLVLTDIAEAIAHVDFDEGDSQDLE